MSNSYKRANWVNPVLISVKGNSCFPVFFSLSAHLNRLHMCIEGRQCDYFLQKFSSKQFNLSIKQQTLNSSSPTRRISVRSPQKLPASYIIRTGFTPTDISKKHKIHVPRPCHCPGPRATSPTGTSVLLVRKPKLSLLSVIQVRRKTSVTLIPGYWA